MHVHVVDAVLDYALQVERLQHAWEVVLNHLFVYVDYHAGELSQLGLVVLAELAQGCVEQMLRFGGYPRLEHGLGVLLKQLVDVFGQEVLNGVAHEVEDRGTEATHKVLREAVHYVVDGHGGHVVADGFVGEFEA